MGNVTCVSNSNTFGKFRFRERIILILYFNAIQRRALSIRNTRLARLVNYTRLYNVINNRTLKITRWLYNDSAASGDFSDAMQSRESNGFIPLQQTGTELQWLCVYVCFHANLAAIAFFSRVISPPRFLSPIPRFPAPRSFFYSQTQIIQPKVHRFDVEFIVVSGARVFSKQ